MFLADNCENEKEIPDTLNGCQNQRRCDRDENSNQDFVGVDSSYLSHNANDRND